MRGFFDRAISRHFFCLREASAYFVTPFVGPDGTLAAFREPLFLGAHGLYGPPHLFTGKVLPLQGDAELIFKIGSASESHQLYKR